MFPHKRIRRWAILDPKYKVKRKKLRVKMRVFKHYGLKCCCCGDADLLGLTIDHIEGNGAEHRAALTKQTNSKSRARFSGQAFYRWLLRNNFPQGYRTLCQTCNFIAYHHCENNTLPKWRMRGGAYHRTYKRKPNFHPVITPLSEGLYKHGNTAKP